MGEKDSIRDFIYLDIERIRSFVAQLSEGLPSERTLGVEHQAGGEVSGEGKIPFLVQASGGADYHFVRSNSETRSLHDYIFAELLRGLQSLGLLRTVPSEQFKWASSAFTDGNFMLVSGIVKIVDYKPGIEALKNLSAIMKLIVRITSKSKTESEQTQEIKQIENQLRNLPIKDVASFIDQFYSELVRIKIFPYSNTAHVFVGTANKQFFRYATTALTGLYGSIIDANWQCLIQINKGKAHSPDEFPGSTNQIEDVAETLIDQLGTLTSLTQGVQFPSVAMTPIAMFREIAN